MTPPNKPHGLPNEMPMKLNTLVFITCLILGLLITLWLMLSPSTAFHQFVARTRIGQNDFVQYWSAGILLRESLPPYDPTRIAALERSQGWQFPQPQVAMYPPWILPVFVLFSYLDMPTAASAWILFGLFQFILASIFIIKYLNLQIKPMLYIPLVGILYFPLMAELIVGNISLLMLTGFVLFLVFQERHWDLAAGSALALMACKPQLLFVLFTVILIWVIRTRRWRILVGGLVSGIFGTLIASSLSPGTLSSFYESSFLFASRQYDNPTLANLFRGTVLYWQYPWLQFIPLLIILPFVLTWFTILSKQIDWRKVAPILILLSVIVAPYQWIHDWVILIPVVYIVVDKCRVLARSYYVLICILLIASQVLLSLAVVRKVNYLEGWFPLLLAVTYFWLQRKVQHRNYNARTVVTS